jgi:hypothetical protein
MAWLPYLGLLCGALVGGELEAQVTVLPDDPAAAKSAADRHAVAEGETLSLLAERYLDNADAWPRLWSFNPEITNPHWIYPGLVLRLHEGVDLTSAPVAGPAGAAGRSSANRLQFARRSKAALGSVLIGEEVYLDREALAQAARIVGSKADHLMLSPTDEVYLQFKKGGSEPSEGKELTVFIRHHRAEVSPTAHNFRTYRAHEAGEVVRVLGALRVKSYDRDKRIARAVVTEALDPIERGFEVADVPRRLAQVPPTRNARDLKAKIVAATRPLGTIGDGQVAFLDVGAKQGVAVGNRFMVVRRGDPWRQQLTLREDLTGAERPDDHPPESDVLPLEVVGELRVLYVRPESSTAIITSSDIELSPGDSVEMRAGL